MFNVWYQHDQNAPMKINIDSNSAISDLQQDIFGTTDKEQYQTMYNGKLLTPSAKVPQDTTHDMLIVFTKIDNVLSPALLQCDECLSAEVNFRCIDCKVSYCATCCATFHKRALAHHQRVPIGEKPIELNRCEQHRDAKLKYWCNCEKLICMDCRLSEQHKDHIAVPISELKAGFKEAQTSLNQAITQSMQPITQTFDALRKMIDNVEKALKNQIHTIEEKNQTSTESYLKQLTIKQKALSDHNGKFENILSTNDHTHLLEAKQSLTNYLEQLMKELKELKSPIKIQYCIEDVDQLQTSIDNILKQARIVESVLGNCFHCREFVNN
ncbi:unnamed protein product [Adineta steineri]|uniref:B box-type domain-containing protein n=1 Tax=Adineta steineri TaxID=433720 RepID=A0A813MW24_9BILA|nr:unnamed protein product [Adineta steineri]CAF3977597.1 unnamed protein product [Adineta steineri]